MDRTEDPSALQRAAIIAGGQSGLARICNRRQSTVWYWLNKTGVLPGEHVLAVEAATGVPRWELRSDLYPRDESPAAATPIVSVTDQSPSVSCDRTGILQPDNDQ